MDEDTPEDALPLEQLYAVLMSLRRPSSPAQAAGADTQSRRAAYVLLQRDQAAEAAAERERMERVQSPGCACARNFLSGRRIVAPAEERWHKAIRAYNAQYRADKQVRPEQSSLWLKAFIPLIRRIVNVVEARLGDLLFPTDGSTSASRQARRPKLDGPRSS